MKKLRNNSQKGITLIALVVTIVVLIILATVSINTVLGDNGIISRAQKARDSYSNSQKLEDEQMAVLANEMAESESNIPTINLTGTSWKIPTKAFVSSTTEGCYVLDLSMKKISSSGTIIVMDNYISTYLYYYTSFEHVVIGGGSFNDESTSQYLKAIDYTATHYVITINGGRDASNETLADWLNTYGENITDSQ